MFEFIRNIYLGNILQQEYLLGRKKRNEERVKARMDVFCFRCERTRYDFVVHD